MTPIPVPSNDNIDRNLPKCSDEIACNCKALILELSTDCISVWGMIVMHMYKNILELKNSIILNDADKKINNGMMVAFDMFEVLAIIDGNRNPSAVILIIDDSDDI